MPSGRGYREAKVVVRLGSEEVQIYSLDPPCRRGQGQRRLPMTASKDWLEMFRSGLFSFWTDEWFSHEWRFVRPNVEAEGPEPAGRAELRIYGQRSAASWRRSTRATCYGAFFRLASSVMAGQEIAAPNGPKRIKFHTGAKSSASAAVERVGPIKTL